MGLASTSIMASPSPFSSLHTPSVSAPSTSLAAPRSLSFAAPRSLSFAACTGGGGRGAAALGGRSLALAPRRRREGGALGSRCLFGLGVPELVVIAGVAALVFGPKKLPEIGRSIGKTVKSFQQAAKEFETELKKDPEDSDKPSAAESPKTVSNEDQKKELEASNTKES